MAEPGRKGWDPRLRQFRSAPTLAVKLNAGRDHNGNPRRGWAIIDLKYGDVVDFVDEGYEGREALRNAYPLAVIGPEFPTTPATYRELKREAERKDK